MTRGLGFCVSMKLALSTSNNQKSFVAVVCIALAWNSSRHSAGAMMTSSITPCASVSRRDILKLAERCFCPSQCLARFMLLQLNRCPPRTVELIRIPFPGLIKTAVAISPRPSTSNRHTFIISKGGWRAAAHSPGWARITKEIESPLAALRPTMA